jgi:2',3'-cyclic-nucleotide 2'-phosphodiesterase (5'-nucleotidase family)
MTCKKSWMTLLLVVLAWTSCAAMPVTVLYTNDVHLRWDRFASMAEIIATERESETHVLLFDAGDTWQDHRQWIQNVWGSSEAISWMNTVSYDAMAVGNHDTYLGSKRLLQLVSRAEFPVLSANWRPMSDRTSTTKASIIVHVEDVAILVIGLTTPEFLPIPAYPDWQYHDPVDSLRDQLQRHASDVDFVFVVGHISIDHACLIARQVPGIDLFISGHSHDRTTQPVVEGTTVIVQSGAFGQTIGRLRLDLDSSSGDIEVLGNDLVDTEKTPVDVRAGVRHLATVLTVIACAIAVWFL